MSKNALLARTFLNDKDVYDMLKTGTFSKQGLLRFLREWGIFLSSNDDWEDIARHVASMSLGWNDVYQLVSTCNSVDRVPRRSTRRITGDWEDEALDEIIDEAKQKLAFDERQTWTKTKSGDRIVISIKAIVTNHSVAKFGQRTEIAAEVEIERTSSGYIVRNDQLEPATEAALLIYKLLNDKSKKPATLDKIELTGVRDPLLRSEFFMKLHRGLSGYRVVDTLDVKIDRRLPALNEDVDSIGNEDESVAESFEEEEEEIKGLVKHAALSGNNLLGSDLYQRLKASGFYIYSLTWTAIETGSGDRKVDFEAGFTKPIEALNFSFGVKRIHPNVQEQEAGTTLGELLRMEGPKHRKAVEMAAYETMEFITEKLAAEKDENC